MMTARKISLVLRALLYSFISTRKLNSPAHVWLRFFTETTQCLWYFTISSAEETVPLCSAQGTVLAARHWKSTQQNPHLLPKDCTYYETLGTQGSCGKWEKQENAWKGHLQPNLCHGSRAPLELGAPSASKELIPVGLSCETAEKGPSCLSSQGAGKRNAMFLDTAVLQPAAAVLLLQGLDIPVWCSVHSVTLFFMVSQHWILGKTKPFSPVLLNIIIQVLGISSAGCRGGNSCRISQP